jgi:hypothetical protein
VNAKIRRALENAAYAATHRDFKGKGEDGVRRMLRLESGGTCSVPVEQFTDVQLLRKVSTLDMLTFLPSVLSAQQRALNYSAERIRRAARYVASLVRHDDGRYVMNAQTMLDAYELGWIVSRANMGTEPTEDGRNWAYFA